MKDILKEIESMPEDQLNELREKLGVPVSDKIVTFSEYEERAGETAQYPGRKFNGKNIYPVLGLCGETGEIAEKIKKVIRDKNGVYTDEDIDLIKKELGDVLWYLAGISYEFGFELSEVATANVEKLRSRKERNKISGSGDNR